MYISRLYRIWLASLAVVATIFIVLLSDTRYNVLAMLKLEFSQTQTYFFAVKSQYNYSADLLHLYLVFDFAFILSFSSLFYTSILMVKQTRRIDRPVGIALFGLIPGLLDVVENTIMWKMLQTGSITNDLFDLFRIVVGLKFLSVLPCICVTVLILYKSLRRRK